MKHSYKSNNNKKAFTLIELLIVIAIIGILFIVLVSKVDFATDKAKATGVQTDFRSFQLALEHTAREAAGFNTFGWDTGDANGDHIRNSYDRGDTNQNGKEDAGETFIGRKTYGEDWTTIYTMINPDTTKPNDTSAFVALEQAINANLDPKLHITITPDVDGGVLTGNATITMANQARDPWKNEYHGVFITNAARDNGADRGAIIIYSDGANGKWGCAHEIVNGAVTVSIPGNNKFGQDDYALVVCYVYVNGYGEVKTNHYGSAPATRPGISNTNNDNVGGGNEPPVNNNCSHVDLDDNGICDKCNQQLNISGSGYTAEYDTSTGTWEKVETPGTSTTVVPSNIISFVGGKFESIFYFNNASYEKVQYTIQETKLNVPRYFSSATFVERGNLDDELHNLPYNGDYIVFTEYGPGELVVGGVPYISAGLGISVYPDMQERTLENAIYLVAYKKKIEKDDDNLRIARWNAETNSYEEINCDAEINAINDFTYTTMTTVTKDVIVTPATEVENIVFIPLGDMQAEVGMTWREWILSSYNTTGFTNMTIRNAEGVALSLDSVIEANRTYGVYDVPKTVLHEGGLYKSGSNYTEQIATWVELINSGLITVTNGVLMGSPDLAGDLIIPENMNITELHYNAFERSKLTSVSLPSSVKKIGNNAFYDCEELISVELNEGLESMGNLIFRNCSKLEGLSLPNSLTEWKHANFNELLGCNLSYIHLGTGLTTVPPLWGTFDAVVVPEGYLDLSNGITIKCNALYVPSSIVTIGSGTATRWSSANIIYYAGTEEEWNNIPGVDKVGCTNIVFNTPYGSES